ncbi:helix-turn-helix transcriptional regulator [Vibrio parahaemolyticus]|uniref:helix-turn-helix transcriptional regulator n=1 Tax=Vibrio harveyi group TaxID=717610 RepID=UPI001D4B6DFA|nr:helix-turn-helix domain-containing protein [Vibrio diabolicus]EGR0528300.1 AlpA family phage regulatory protein [Vibrio parahaemolyticus]EGR0561295.1 AlpA family phage regulatory protein [Vibrio parahaemolyticus]EHK0726812.1 AlpA family phage regulatory protein [Vibrio parahaemolyticus]EJF9952016.1 AlpA family phage regulatory protein [Vibrio parahaemolyticus]EKI0386350.1 AlpA family phage regulatory protein [Vibrio parahaemolyticus]
MTRHFEQLKDIDRVLSLDEVAFILGKSKKTLWRLTKNKVMPAPLKVNGRAIGYRASTLEKFLNSLEGGE